MSPPDAEVKRWAYRREDKEKKKKRGYEDPEAGSELRRFCVWLRGFFPCYETSPVQRMLKEG